MLNQLQDLAAWFAAALALGLFFGVILGVMAGRGGGGLPWRGWSALFALAWLGGLVVAILGKAPGREALWLEAGLAIFGLYGIGGAIGFAVARAFARRPASPVPPQPDWIGAADQAARDARIFLASVPRTLSALQEAAEFFLAAEEERKGVAPSTAETSAPPASPVDPSSHTVSPPLQDELARIHGLDGEAYAALCESGLGSLDALARLSQGEREDLAKWLGRGESVVAYWSAQARLLARGIETGVLPPLQGANGSPLDESEARLLIGALPQAVAPQAHDSFYAGERPLGLLSPPGGAPDDLGRIAGIDTNTAKSLNALGIWSFRQIASWSAGEGRWVESFLASPGRVGREQWGEQAARLIGLTREKRES